MQFARWLNLHPYDWTGRAAQKPASSMAQSGMFLRQFMPAEFARYEWKLVEKPRHLIAALLLVLAMEVLELNAFFLKYVLYMPPETPFNALRLTFLFALSLPATREYYDYATDPSTRRLGPNIWLLCVLAVVEVTVVVKFSAETPFPPDAHIPVVVLRCWALAGTCALAWCVLKFGKQWGGAPASASGGHDTPRSWRSAAGKDARARRCASLVHRAWRPTVMNLLITAAITALAFLAWSQDAGMYGLGENGWAGRD